MADKPEPSIRNDERKNRSPKATPVKPLKTKSRKWFIEIDSKLVFVKNIVKKNPKMPIKFFKIFICILLKRRDENSNKITADDQQIAVRIA